MKTFLLTVSSFATPVFAWAQEAAESAKESGGAVPHFDPTYFPSQIFWLAVCFITMYLVMSKIALPRVSRIVDARDDQVRQDLENAARMRREAGDLKMMYTRSLRDADERAKFTISRIHAELVDKNTKALADSNAAILKKIAEAETKLAAEKETLLTEISPMGDRLGKVIAGELDRARAA